MDEIEEIKRRYKRRETKVKGEISFGELLFNFYLTCERELKYFQILHNNFGDLSENIKILEVGAGTGYNLHFFNRIGIPWTNIWANELLEERTEILKSNFPLVNIISGDAMEIEINEKFDVVLQSTVFTSILDLQYRINLANKIYNLLKPKGILLWYDFIYDNPWNKDVKGIGKRDIKKLFPQAKRIEFNRVTLAPPIGRRVKKCYNLVNFLAPFLRTHLIAVIQRD